MKTTFEFSSLINDLPNVIMTMDQFLSESHDLDADGKTDEKDFELYLELESVINN